jgi:hypothetical protein
MRRCKFKKVMAMASRVRDHYFFFMATTWERIRMSTPVFGLSTPWISASILLYPPVADYFALSFTETMDETAVETAKSCSFRLVDVSSQSVQENLGVVISLHALLMSRIAIKRRLQIRLLLREGSRNEATKVLKQFSFGRAIDT